jgi:hypothetical protein
MNDPKPDPRHEADEKPSAGKHGGVPIGTHSLTGSGSAVGMPPRAKEPERDKGSAPDAPAAEEPDPLAEPRANTGRGILGPKP